MYEPAGGGVAGLPAAARRILSVLPAGRQNLLDELRRTEPAR
ncbi:hypothetical protein [Streptomyces blattellae]